MQRLFFVLLLQMPFLKKDALTGGAALLYTLIGYRDKDAPGRGFFIRGDKKGGMRRMQGTCMTDVSQYLRANTYPGRGILVGMSADGVSAVAAYFIMGRSENSRNRIFEKRGEDLYTRAFDESRVEDPSLILYAPMRVLPGRVIVTNGDQTDTIAEALHAGGNFIDALMTRCYEPDEPHCTPRISALLTLSPDAYAYQLSILKRAQLTDGCVREYFCYPGQPGAGHLIHTYAHDGNPLPSFCTEPVCVRLDTDPDRFCDLLWESLDADNRISLYVRWMNLKTGAVWERIVNRNV